MFFFKITVVLRQDDSHIIAFLIFRIKARTSNGKTIGCVESHVGVVQTNKNGDLTNTLGVLTVSNLTN